MNEFERRIDTQPTVTTRGSDPHDAGEPLSDYLAQRPSLMLTFLEVAERYSGDMQERP